MRVLATTLLRLTLAACALGLASYGAGAEVATGLMAIDAGDDVPRPAAVLHVGITPQWLARAYAYGRSYANVKEENTMLSAARRYPLFRSQSWDGTIGATLLSDTVSLSDTAQPDNSEKASTYNFGATFGLHWHSDNKSSRFYWAIDWEGHLFPAGVAGIFLATGRRHGVAALIGIAL